MAWARPGFVAGFGVGGKVGGGAVGSWIRGFGVAVREFVGSWIRGAFVGSWRGSWTRGFVSSWLGLWVRGLVRALSGSCGELSSLDGGWLSPGPVGSPDISSGSPSGWKNKFPFPWG